MSKKWNKYKGEQPPDYTPSGFDQYLGLGRRIDVWEKYNKIAYVTALVCIAASIVYKGMYKSLVAADLAMSAMATGMAFLFSYLIAQEIDPEPERRWAGIVGGILTAVACTVLGDGNIMVSLWMLFAVRMLNRTSGDRHRIVDNVLLIAIAVYQAYVGAWLFPLLTAAFYIIESQITDGYFRSLYLAGIACLGCFAANKFTSTGISMNYLSLMAMSLILFLPELRFASLTKVKGDKNGKPISTKRLVAAQGCFMMGIVVLAMFHGDKMFLSLLPSIMAALGCGLYLFVYIMQHQPRAKK